jgi:hypothetical protein
MAGLALIWDKNILLLDPGALIPYTLFTVCMASSAALSKKRVITKYE